MPRLGLCRGNGAKQCQRTSPHLAESARRLRTSNWQLPSHDRAPVLHCNPFTAQVRLKWMESWNRSSTRNSPQARRFLSPYITTEPPQGRRQPRQAPRPTDDDSRLSGNLPHHGGEIKAKQPRDVTFNATRRASARSLVIDQWASTVQVPSPTRLTESII